MPYEGVMQGDNHKGLSAGTIRALTKEKMALFEAMLRSINNTIGASSMYPPRHPMQLESVKLLKGAMDAWFHVEPKVELGFSPDNILVGARFIKEKDPLFASVAGYFHKRGLQAVSVARGVSEAELAAFFEAVRDPPEAIAEAGGVGRRMRPCAHIKIKEIDYSALLSASRRSAAADPVHIWESLCRIGDGHQAGGVARSTLESLLEKIKDGGKAASALNAAYERAGNDRDAVAGRIWQVIENISREGAKLPADRARNVREYLAVIVTKLNRELVAGLFDKGMNEAASAEAQDTVLDALPDAAVADLIASLINKEGKIDRNLVGTFQKISAKKTKAESVSSLVAERLLQSGKSMGESLDRMQEAIREVFDTAPNNPFVSQVYKLTLDALARDVGPLAFVSEQVRDLVKEYELFVDPRNLTRETARLLLNILWFEKNSAQFKQFSDMLLATLRQCEDGGVGELARDALTVYAGRSQDEQIEEAIVRECGEALSRLGRSVGAPFLISLVPQAAESELASIGRSLDAAGMDSAGAILDAFLRERSSDAKRKFGLVLSGMALTRERVNSIVSALGKEKNSDAKDSMLGVLLNSRDARVLNDLFDNLGKGFFISKQLRRLVRLCGVRRVGETVPFLGAILSVRPLIDWRGHGALRVAAAESLAQIGSPEAVQVLEKHAGDKNPAVRTMCLKAPGSTPSK